MAPVPVAETGMVITLFGVVDLAQHIADFVHDLEEIRIQVPHYGESHRLQHAGMYRAWARA